MSTKATTRILFGLSVIVLVVTAVAITALVRGESTRNIVQKSPCTADPASKECQQVKRDSDRERSVRDSCIPFKKVLTKQAYFEITRCPREVVADPKSSEIPVRPDSPNRWDD